MTNSVTELPSRLFVERTEKLGFLERGDDRRPMVHDFGLRLISEIEQELEIDVENARVVFRPLDVAAHPVKGISDPAQHRL